MNDIIIRTATLNDDRSIATIHVLTWQCAYKGIVPGDYLDRLSIDQKTQTWRKQLEHPKDNTHTFVAEKDGVVVGWCTAGVSRDTNVSKDTGELYGIYMHPDYINQGIGSELMEYALSILKEEGYKKATLWVLDSNEKSRKFYEKNNWKIEGKTKKEVRDGFVLDETRYIIDL